MCSGNVPLFALTNSTRSPFSGAPPAPAATQAPAFSAIAGAPKSLARWTTPMYLNSGFFGSL
jgi:hypothetical protein